MAMGFIGFTALVVVTLLIMTCVKFGAQVGGWDQVCLVACRGCFVVGHACQEGGCDRHHQ